MTILGLAHERITPTDSSRLLGLTTEGARIILALFVFSNFLFVVTTIDEVKHPFPPLAAAMIVNAAAVLLVLDHPDPFPMRWTLAVMTAVVSSTVLVAFQLPDAGPVGRASWHLGANAWLLFFLALRGRRGYAWLSYGLMGAVTVLWAVTSGRGYVAGLNLLDTHGAILFVATLFAINLRRTARRINEFDDRAISGAVETATASAAVEIRHQRVLELQASAGPLLERIVRSTSAPDEEQRKEYRAAEAMLRDGVRGKSLATPQIEAAATAARDKGVDVTLLDDRGDGLPSGDAMARLATAVVGVLGKVEDGSVTVRLHPRGRAVAVSIVATGTDHSERIELDANGLQLREGLVIATAEHAPQRD